MSVEFRVVDFDPKQYSVFTNVMIKTFVQPVYSLPSVENYRNNDLKLYKNTKRKGSITNTRQRI